MCYSNKLAILLGVEATKEVLLTKSLSLQA